jgi:hypothetical protein
MSVAEESNDRNVEGSCVMFGSSWRAADPCFCPNCAGAVLRGDYSGLPFRWRHQKRGAALDICYREEAGTGAADLGLSK